jgi:pimeloyl-ACP methyl ester carboxylesterase
MTFISLNERLVDAYPDPELRRLAPGLSVAVEFRVGGQSIGLSVVDGRLFKGFTGEPTMRIEADESEWASVLSTPPAATYHSFTALQIANPAFEVSGDAQLIAQARPFLERLFELVTLTPATPAGAVERSLSQIQGRYAEVHAAGQAYEMYYEVAGEGVPLLFLHTAGADGRQYFAQMADVQMAQQFRMYAIDLPFHGKSMPPRTWDGAPYLLTSERYQQWCTAFIEQVIGAPAIVVGGSMGAAMSLVLAADYPEQLIGVVALEPPFQSRGRRNPYQNHVQVHGGLHNGAYVRGLMSPTSPVEDRRRASWIYSQGGPGVYPGDLAFYSDEFDGAVTAPRIDVGRTPVALLSGTYDYSATPADGAKLAELIPGSLHLVMDGLGHFPMTEHPDHFRSYLIQGLAHVAQQKGLKNA